MTTEDPMVIWERKKAIKAAERAVIAAAEKLHAADELELSQSTIARSLNDLLGSVSALREARGE